MTQLVQLQQVLPALRAAGYEVFAISNDTVDRLADFSERHAISFPLLSDEDSAVIRSFGILNTLIQPGEGTHMRWYGIPYPGTYVTDADGVVVDKDFHQHHARRLSGQALLHRILGTTPEPEDDAPIVTATGDSVTLTAYLADPVLRLEVISTLVCRLSIPPGLHIYATGSPDAFTPAVLHLHGDGVRFGEAIWPQPAVLELSDLDMTVPVHHGEVTVTVPITATTELIRLGHGLDQATVDVTVSCVHQACDDTACRMPATVTATLTLPLEVLVEPDGLKTYVARVEQRAAKPSPVDGDRRR